jgi:hypothetical protein
MSRVVLFMASQLSRGVRNHSPFLHKDTSQSSAKRTLLALIHFSNILTQVSVPAEDESQQSGTFTHALKGPPLSCPIMPLADKHFHIYFNSYKLSTNNKILINNKITHS